MTLRLFDRSYDVKPLQRGNSENLGEAQFKEGTLWYDPSSPKYLISRTLLHELLHVGFADMGVEKWNDESYIGNIEFIVAHIIYDNPSLMKDLMKKWQ